MILLALAFAIGVLVGRSIAYQQSAGGLGGIIGAGLWLYGTIAGFLVVVVLVVIAARIGCRPVRAALAPVVLGGLLVVAGGIVGHVTAAFTGGLQRNAEVLTSAGTITLRLDDLESAYQAAEASSADCRSLPDGMDVAEVTGLALGTLDGRHLRGTVFLPFGNEASARAEIWIDGADLPEGAAQPFWTGPITASNPAGEDRPGQATFDALELTHDPKLPPYSEPFPERLAGSLDWRCELFRLN